MALHSSCVDTLFSGVHCVVGEVRGEGQLPGPLRDHG